MLEYHPDLVLLDMMMPVNCAVRYTASIKTEL